MGCAQCHLRTVRPPPAPWASNTGGVRDVLGDGRLLADYTVFLLETANKEAIQRLWQLELRRDSAVASTEAAEWLADSWQAYRQSPTGLGNFDDTREWEMHDLPAKEIVHRVRSSTLVDKEDEMYTFAVAAMVGLHVATVCSSIIDRPREDKASFRNYDILQSESSRRYKIPVQGSAYSPKLILPEPFEIEEFAPELFAQLRSLSGVSNTDYMHSLCRIDFEFIKFRSNSKSGQFFFFSHDEKYLLKTAAPGESETLLAMLVDMRNRIRDEPRSMLGRYLGLYRLTISGRMRLFLVMRAIPATKVKVHRTFDLKGSTRNRRAKPGEDVGKDVNFHEEVGRFDVAPEVAGDLARIHAQDLDLLSEHAIMDYSILCMIHDTNMERPEEASKPPTASTNRLHAEAPLPTVSLRSFAGPPVASVPSIPLKPPPVVERGISAPPTLGFAGPGSWLVRSVGIAEALAMPTAVAEQGANNPHTTGIRSADGSKTYYFGLIDLLVAYTAYPKAQYHGTQVITCGNAHEASRIPPQDYARRQVHMFHKLCGLQPKHTGFEDSTDESESSGEEGSSEEA